MLVVYLWKTKSFRWPAQTAPLLGFLLVALISTVVGGLSAPLDLRGKTYWMWALRAWLSLGIGMGFFWVSVYLSRSEEFLRKSLPWLYTGLAISIVWGVIQAIALNTALISLELVNKIQLSFSIREVAGRRIFGFAYEPSWLADQMTIFYFPWLFASLLTRMRISKYRWLEPVLALGAIGLLLLSYSRSGVIGLVVSVAVALLTVGRGLLVGAWSWFWGPFVLPGDPRPVEPGPDHSNGDPDAGRGFPVAGSLSVFCQSVGCRLEQWPGGLCARHRCRSAGRVYPGRGEYLQPEALVGCRAGGEQFLSLRTFACLGADQSLRDRPAVQPPSTTIPNVRNLIIRLLSETGIIGFWFYLAFNISILGSIRKMFLSRKKLMVFASVAGLTAWPAIILRQFTLSTLTAPVIWVTLGMVVGYAHHVLDVPEKSAVPDKLEIDKE